jgi:hypothetical protein
VRLREWISSRRALLVAFALTLPLVTPRIRGADEIEYFSYLPSIVFDRDLSFGNEYRHFYERDPAGLAGFKETFLDLREPVTGRHINFAPLGSALLWSPFYLGAHAGVVAARALGSDVPADGYSLPYAAAACYASALYAFAGLLLVHGVLRRHGGVPEPAATLSVLGLWFGTPVLYYMTIAPAFSHSCSLFAVALVVSLTLREDERRGDGVLPWALLGAGCGLAGLVREQDVLIGVLPGGLLASRLLRERRLSVALRQALALAAGAALVFLPQLLAYRALNGGFGPSRMVARKMSWSSPHFLEVLLDPGHGLFLWTPLLLVAAVGLAAAVARRDPPRSLPWLALALLLQVWINGAVESWSQAGAFGSRRFVGATPIFAFGLAGVVAAGIRRFGTRLPALAVALCVWWNLSLMVQFGLNIMDRQRLRWPEVARAQLTEVPQRLGGAAWLFFTDRERLVREVP